VDPNVPFLDFAIALFIGALVGLEREKSSASDEPRGIGGLRTFILFAQAGAVAAWLAVQFKAPWIFIGTGGCVTAMVLAGYREHVRQPQSSRGLTTEIAALVVFLLGGTTLAGYPSLAVALAIATSALLAYKQPLHGWVGRLDQDDFHAGLKLLIATFIVLPVLPNRPVDPWGALNPYQMWWLVILIAGLSLVGYVVSRWLGPDRGLPLTGFFGGLVSSTAVSLTFARRSQDQAGAAGLPDALATGLLLSWSVMFVRVLVAVGVVNPTLLSALAVPLAAMGLPTLLAAALFYFRSRRVRTVTQVAPVSLKNPFSLTSAIKFALLFAVVLWVVKVAERHFAAQGVYLIAGVAGLTDVDAITLSLAGQAKSTIAPSLAVTAIILAIISNTLVKCGFVVALGSPPLKRRILMATAVIVAGGVISRCGG
jgi:uncharacterized membrane protein (DUF4010 family)